MQPFRNYRRPFYRQAPEIQVLIGRCSPPPATSAGEQRQISNCVFPISPSPTPGYSDGFEKWSAGYSVLDPPPVPQAPLLRGSGWRIPADVFATPPTFPELRRPSRSQAPGTWCLTFAVSGPSLPGFPLPAGGCKSQAPGTRCSTFDSPRGDPRAGGTAGYRSGARASSRPF